MSHQDKRWVIVFVIYADFRTDDTFSMNESMKGEINAMFSDILTCPLNCAAASLFVVMDGIRYVSESQHDTVAVEEISMLYEIEPSLGGGMNKFGTCVPLRKYSDGITLSGLRSHILQREDKLTKILRLIPVESGEEIFLITWDHGSAFGVFREETFEPLPPILRKPIDNNLEDFPYLNIFWRRAQEENCIQTLLQRKSGQKRGLTVQIGHNIYTVESKDQESNNFIGFISNQNSLDSFSVIKNPEGRTCLVHDQQQIELGDPKVPEILKNKELSNSLNNWLADKPVKKVGVLLMMNCWMMNLHTLYTLKNNVKYLVAPQGNIDSPGYNYLYILRSIYTASEGLDPQQLATNCVDFSHNCFAFARAGKLNKEFPDTINFRTIVNVRLDYPQNPSPFDQLLAETSSLIDRLYTVLNNDPNKAVFFLMRYLRELALEFTQSQASMIDLPNYLASLNFAIGDLASPLLNDLRTSFLDLENWAQKDLPVILPRFIGTKWNAANHQAAPWLLTGVTPTGYSIFFPHKKITDDNVTDNIKKDDLLSESSFKWNDIIKKLYGNII